MFYRLILSLFIFYTNHIYSSDSSDSEGEKSHVSPTKRQRCEETDGDDSAGMAGAGYGIVSSTAALASPLPHLTTAYTRSGIAIGMPEVITGRVSSYLISSDVFSVSKTDKAHYDAFEKYRKVYNFFSKKNCFSIDLCETLDQARAQGLRTYLKIEKDGLGDDKINNFRKLLTHCSAVVSLDLTWNYIGMAEVTELIQSDSLKNLEHLILKINRIGDAEITLISQSPNFAKLTHLSLDYNYIADAGITALARSPHIVNLKQLHLYNNDIRPAGAIALINSEIMTNLRILDLCYNKITNKDAVRERFPFVRLDDKESYTSDEDSSSDDNSDGDVDDIEEDAEIDA
jgi:hypothetical protein